MEGFKKPNGRLLLNFLLSLSLIVITVFVIRHHANAADEETEPTTNATETLIAGAPLSGMSSQELALFNAGKEVFEELQSVTGQEPGAEDAGLGPRFNLNSCVGCHAHPSTGGSSPAVNPQVAVATRYGAKNKIPYFVSTNGPVREARFKYNADGTRDGGVKDLFVISGRLDSKGCNIKQPNFDQAAANNNIIFRIPTPLFGAGLIEAIPDEAIIENMAADNTTKKGLGIRGKENRTDTILGMGGHVNRNGNDGTITRFGWKAQNKSLELFSAEAYNVEQGVTNEIFQNERDENKNCHFNPVPENITNAHATSPYDVLSDVTKFSFFMRFLAPPTPKPFTDAAKRGFKLFKSVGCALCHTPSLKTGNASSPALSNQTVNLFSDLILHSMGPGLADEIVQQFAGPDDFRTAPLWGLSQRLFFLHDGRTSDLTTAILAHASTNPACAPTQDVTADGIHCRSEANVVISRFQQLQDAEKADLLEFLKSL